MTFFCSCGVSGSNSDRDFEVSVYNLEISGS